MSWKSEHGSSFEVPGFVDFLVKRGVIKDLSWKNDASPLFGLIDDDSGNMAALFVDHPIASFREIPGDRFTVVMGVSGETPIYDKSYSELEPALEDFFGVLARWKFAFEEKGRRMKGDWEDPKNYLYDLLERYRDQ